MTLGLSNKICVAVLILQYHRRVYFYRSEKIKPTKYTLQEMKKDQFAKLIKYIHVKSDSSVGKLKAVFILCKMAFKNIYQSHFWSLNYYLQPEHFITARHQRSITQTLLFEVNLIKHFSPCWKHSQLHLRNIHLRNAFHTTKSEF